MDHPEKTPSEQPQPTPVVPPEDSQPAVSEAPLPPPPQAKASDKPARKVSAPKEPACWGTGRRKESIARVRLLGGTGTILVNRQPFDRYFPRETLRLAIRQPLIVTHQLGKHNVFASVDGGGLTGQAGALRLGIARALVQFDPGLRATLRGAGLLTRDPRQKERKKYGQKGARKRFQWTKR